MSLIGLSWGLPTPADDSFLFPTGRAWTGQQIVELTGGGTRNQPQRGADVDVNPLNPSAGPQLLNADPETQAEIYRRYRLFTAQPDEMITMMALSGMNPRRLQLDPKLYQYGGLFIYPVGALIGACGAAGLMPVAGDPIYYLDHPADFGRFYLVARAYSAAWGLAGVFVVFAIGRRLGGTNAGALAALLFALLPVVACMAHEAKPHLPGAVLMLTAVWLAMRWLASGAGRDWWLMSAACGAAVGMVLSSAPILVLIPAAQLLRARCARQLQSPVANLGSAGLDGAPAPPTTAGRRPPAWSRWTFLTPAGVLLAGFIYLITNPYIAINLVANRAVLRSNFGNSLAMYEIARWHDGLRRMAELTIEGATLPIALLGLIALVAALARRRRDACRPASPYPQFFALAVPAAVFALQFVLIGAGKPDEYGRFGIFYEAALAIGAACTLTWLARRLRIAALAAGAATLACCLLGVGGYLWSFHADANGFGSRAMAARALTTALATTTGDVVGPDRPSLAVWREPAPYCCPPLDFAGTPVVLVRDAASWRDLIEGSFPSPAAAPLVGLLACDAPERDIPAWMAGGRLRYQMRVFESRLWPLPQARVSWANKPLVLISVEPR